MKRNSYTQKHYDFIRKNVVNTEKELTDLFNAEFNLNVSISVIGNLKHKVGIKSGLVGGQFQKGETSWNKGKTWQEFMSIDGQKNSSKTTFKKGNIPHNHRPTGSARITKYGYVEVKIAEPNRWKLKHRLIYEKQHGKLSSKTKIIFLDGNKQNFNIENLEAISNEQSLIMNQNNYFTGNKDITKTGVIVSKLLSESRKFEKEGK